MLERLQERPIATPITAIPAVLKVSNAGSVARPIRSATSLSSALQITNSDQVAISDGSDVGVVQADEGLRLAGCQDELDLKTIWFMNVNDGTKISATKPVLGQVPI